MPNVKRTRRLTRRLARLDRNALPGLPRRRKARRIATLLGR